MKGQLLLLFQSIKGKGKEIKNMSERNKNGCNITQPFFCFSSCQIQNLQWQGWTGSCLWAKWTFAIFSFQQNYFLYEFASFLRYILIYISKILPLFLVFSYIFDYIFPSLSESNWIQGFWLIYKQVVDPHHPANDSDSIFVP